MPKSGVGGQRVCKSASGIFPQVESAPFWAVGAELSQPVSGVLPFWSAGVADHAAFASVNLYPRMTYGRWQEQRA